jgi:hypothetical protein
MNYKPGDLVLFRSHDLMGEPLTEPTMRNLSVFPDMGAIAQVPGNCKQLITGGRRAAAQSAGETPGNSLSPRSGRPVECPPYRK